MGSSWKKILVINKSHVGDVIMASAAMKSLRSACPDAQIDLVVPYVCAPIVSYPGIVDHVFARRPHAGRLESLLKTIDALRWRAGKYDAVFFFEESVGAVRRITWLSNIPVRVCPSHDINGAGTKISAYCTHVVPTGSVWDTHVLEWYQSIITGFFGRAQESSLSLSLSLSRNICISRFDFFFKKSGRKIGLCFTCSLSGLSTWPESSCIALIRRLAADGDQLLMCVSPGADKFQAERLKTVSGADICIAETTLSECAALMRKLDLFVSVDTGQVHVAAALGIPVLSLAGSTTTVTYPYSERGLSIATSRGCFECRFIDACPSNRKTGGKHNAGYVPPCMAALSVDTVYEHTRKMLENPWQRERYRIVEV